MLGLMEDAEIAATYRRERESYLEQSCEVQHLLSMAVAVREQGCVLVFDSFGEAGVAGFGVAFKMGDHGIGAIGIATLTARFGFERQHKVGQLIETELRGLG